MEHQRGKSWEMHSKKGHQKVIRWVQQRGWEHHLENQTGQLTEMGCYWVVHLEMHSNWENQTGHHWVKHSSWGNQRERS